MTPYLDCHHARLHLTSYVDGELPLGEQVALEAHLRWCATCAAEVSDAEVIGNAIRRGACTARRDDENAPAESALAAMRAAVVARIGEERRSTVTASLRAFVDDRRLLWPALGGTLALVVALGVTGSVLRAASEERPESLAGMLEVMSTRGSERNPMTPEIAPSFERPVRLGKPFENRSSIGVSLPRVLGDTTLWADTGLWAASGDAESEVTVAAVVNREGRVANYSVLSSPVGRGGSRAEAGAVQDAVARSRFEPAQTPMGEAVAVNVIWVIVHQTVKPARVAVISRARVASEGVEDEPAARPLDVPPPSPPSPHPPVPRRSGIPVGSATA